MDTKQRQTVRNVWFSELSPGGTLRIEVMEFPSVLRKKCERTMLELQRVEEGKYVCVRRIPGSSVRPRHHSRAGEAEEAVSVQDIRAGRNH